MRPLKITAKMMTGEIITYDKYLPFDAAMADIWMRENHPEIMASSQSSISQDNLIIAELPLARLGQGDDWYWACSFACGEILGEEIVYWHKRFDSQNAEEFVDFGKRRGAVNTSSAKYKNYRMPMVKVLVPELVWYAVGELSDVERLVKKIPALGKKRSQGFGIVREWIVAEWPEDLSSLRAIPDENGEFYTGIKPPYWLPLNKRRCHIPDDERMLCNA